MEWEVGNVALQDWGRWVCAESGERAGQGGRPGESKPMHHQTVSSGEVPWMGKNSIGERRPTGHDAGLEFLLGDWSFANQKTLTSGSGFWRE